MNEDNNEPQSDLTEDAPRQPEGIQPATVPGAENPESDEIKNEVNPNTE
jgi:hypothetical protein